MSEPENDLLGKLDALMKRHRPEADVPVLTDIVVPSPLDLDAIPVLTEEVSHTDELAQEETPPFPELLPELPPEPLPPVSGELAVPRAYPAPPQAQGEVQPSTPPLLEFEIPPEARYVRLTDLTPAPPAEEDTQPLASVQPPADQPTPALHALSEETIQLIADTIKADVAKILDAQLQQALAQQLQASLHLALDRALASMLDQFMIHIEEVVRLSIASELERQLGRRHGPWTQDGIEGNRTTESR